MGISVEARDVEARDSRYRGGNTPAYIVWVAYLERHRELRWRYLARDWHDKSRPYDCIIKWENELGDNWFGSSAYRPFTGGLPPRPSGYRV